MALKKKAADVFRVTFPFCLLKLALYGIVIAVDTVLFIILFAVGSSIGEDVAAWFVFIWIILALSAFFSVRYFAGYILKAGHIAAAADYIRTSMTPDRAYPYAMLRVRKRFRTVTQYHEIYSLIRDSVSQLVSFIERSGGFVKKDKKSAPVLIDIQLGFIACCCLGYVFYNDRANVHKSAADGVAVFYENWKKLLSRSNLTAILTLVCSAISGAIGFLLAFIIFHAIPASSAYAPVISLVYMIMIGVALMSSLFSSWITVSLLTSYLRHVPSAELSFDLYGRLCGYSKAFKRLFSIGKSNEGYTQQSIPLPQYLRRSDGTVTGGEDYADDGYTNADGYGDDYDYEGENDVEQDEQPDQSNEENDAAPQYRQNAAEQKRNPAQPAARRPNSVFCGECGARNEPGAKFCENCGAKL